MPRSLAGDDSLPKQSTPSASGIPNLTGNPPAAPPPGPAAPRARSRRRIAPQLVAIVVGGSIGFLGASGRLTFGGGGSAGLPLFCLGAIVGLNLHLLLAVALARPGGLAPIWASVGGGRALGRTVRGG